MKLTEAFSRLIKDNRDNSLDPDMFIKTMLRELGDNFCRAVMLEDMLPKLIAYLCEDDPLTISFRKLNLAL